MCGTAGTIDLDDAPVGDLRARLPVITMLLMNRGLILVE